MTFGKLFLIDLSLNSSFRSCTIVSEQVPLERSGFPPARYLPAVEETSSKELTQKARIQRMAESNCTQATEFSLVGFTEDPGTQVTLFLMFLLTYLVTILGNLGMIALIRASPQLHSPMYYFLGNLAFVDVCSSTVITPKMLVDFISEKKGIAYAGCVAQVFVFDLFGMTECFLLAMMAYDRYVAICHPLVYPLVMSPKCCFQLVTGSYLVGLTNGTGQTIGVSNLSFCGSSVIDLFFCDISALISLSTSDTTLSRVILRTSASLFGVSSSLVVLVSYVAIISAILSISSAEGKRKAFSTCASHLTTVSIFYGTSLFMYLKPSSDSSKEDKWAAVLYTVVTPLLNPLIYSLRNKEVKEALRRLTKKMRMAGGNHSKATKFVLLGFTDLQELLFMIFFLLIYNSTLVGNLGMIILIMTNSLHLPMYFFLSHLSLLDICYSLSITPKLLLGLLAERNLLSFDGCIQFFFFAVFGTTEAILLTVMAYDCYVAICEPLHYLTAVSRVCVQLVVGSYAARSLNTLVHTSALLRLSFCDPNLVNHFYCEIPPLLLLSCSDTWLNEMAMAMCAGFITTTSVLAIVVSYTCTLLTVWSIHSTEGRHKAFSTCISHLMAIALFYSSAAFLYFHPFSRHAEDQGKTASVFYTVVSPMLNPFIYSLGNKVRSTLRRATNKLLSCMCSHGSCSNQTEADSTRHSGVSRRNKADT
ncbi:LOW QUALITY PROTEIN: uncharacterized protein LJ206_011582 [Theristicus caerulescens]